MTSNDLNIFIEKSLLLFSRQFDITAGTCNCRTDIENVTEGIITERENYNNNNNVY